MSSTFVLRLTFDLAAAGLLLVGMAYWWLGNTVHEVVGTAMFLLLIVHNLFNRRWYSTAAGTPRDTRGLFNMCATLLLLMAMLALLVTSMMISETLSGTFPVAGSFAARQIHTLAAYWVLVMTAVHLGLRWPMLMGTARSLLGLSKPSAWRTLVLRVVAVIVAIHGVWNSFVLGIGTKLSMRMTLDWWNFEESAGGFFIHCGAVAGLYMGLTHYGMKWVHRQRRRRASPAAIMPNLIPR